MSRLHCDRVIKVLNCQVAEVNVLACYVDPVCVQRERWKVVQEGSVISVVHVDHQVLDSRVEQVVEVEVETWTVHEGHTVDLCVDGVAEVEEDRPVVLPGEDHVPPPPVAVAVYQS